MRLTSKRELQIKDAIFQDGEWVKDPVPELLKEIEALRIEKMVYHKIVHDPGCSISVIQRLEKERDMLRVALEVAKQGLRQCKIYSACEEEIESEVKHVLGKIDEIEGIAVDASKNRSNDNN